MARYKETEMEQGLIIPVNLYEQLIPGTYEYTLNDLIDKDTQRWQPSIFRSVVRCNGYAICSMDKRISLAGAQRSQN